MPVFQERTSEVLLKEAETLHNLARRAKRSAVAASDEAAKKRLLKQARELEQRAVILEREASRR
jgi:hypothetical protein